MNHQLKHFVIKRKWLVKLINGLFNLKNRTVFDRIIEERKLLSVFNYVELAESIPYAPREIVIDNNLYGIAHALKKYANLDGSELNMVFQFEHMGTTDGKYGKWTTRKPEMKKVRAVMNKWQTKLEGKAWNSLYWDNHDQPRAVSRFGDDSPMYRDISAKMIATCLHMLKGSPYIYQGEEIGMTNAYFKSISDYRDIESINAYKEYTESGLMTEEEMLNCLKMISRDNARTPMQWDDSANAGFTTGTPWISVNKNYTQINAKAALEDKDSVFYYYQKLIRLRHQYEVIVEGVFHGLLEDNDDIYAYERTLGNEKLVVACNFTNKEVPCELFEENKGEELITNYKNHVEGILQPYETRVILYK